MTDLFKEDLEGLFLVEKLRMGDRELRIAPFTISSLPDMVEFYRNAQGDFEEAGLTLETVFEGSNLTALARIIASKAPGLMALASGLPTETIRRLPLPFCLELAVKILRVNLTAAEALEKNWVESLEELAGMVTSASEKLSSSLSSPGIPGEMSKGGI